MCYPTSVAEPKSKDLCDLTLAAGTSQPGFIFSMSAIFLARDQPFSLLIASDGALMS